jgi:SHS2 domain-containing protein
VTKPRYEQLEHTADLALRVYGQDLCEVFANAAYAMFSQLADIEHIQHKLQRQVSVEGTDYESLLVNWLNELLYLHETEDEVYSAFDIEQLSPQRLQATVHGGPSREVFAIIKAATYHDLAISQTADGYTASVVFDV